MGVHTASTLSPPSEALATSFLMGLDKGRATTLGLCFQPHRSGWAAGRGLLSSAVGDGQGQTEDGRTLVIWPQGLLVVLPACLEKSRFLLPWVIETARLHTVAFFAPVGAKIDAAKPPGLWRCSEWRQADLSG